MKSGMGVRDGSALYGARGMEEGMRKRVGHQLGFGFEVQGGERREFKHFSSPCAAGPVLSSATTGGPQPSSCLVGGKQVARPLVVFT